MQNEEEKDMVAIADEKMSINAFAEMKSIIKKEMKEQGLTASEVKKALADKKNEN